MRIPYGCLQVYGDLLFAARGGKIHSFSTTDGSYISTWKHPDVDKTSSALIKTPIEANSSIPGQNSAVGGPNASPEPPSKRRRLEASASASTTPQESNGKPEPQTKSKKAKQKGPQKGTVPSLPIISLMTMTPSGSHLIVCSTHDKAIFVLEHDGSGNLKELSKRVMPKRPCALVVEPTNDTSILCADKFGDVYALPLLPKEDVQDGAASTKKTLSRAVKGTFKPEADITTVHSKQNLNSLAQQHRTMELGAHTPRQEGPTFEHSLLLGHISMLTAMVLASHNGRNYIVTADRDEHIRVSRSIPQTHVIEAYCLGHREFVSAMTVPLARPDVLVSGGGDPDLFVWDWRAGRLLGEINLLGYVADISEDITKVAVTRICSVTVPNGGDTAAGTGIFVLCEDVPAVIYFELTAENTAARFQHVILPGKPLDLAPVTRDGSFRRVIIALDCSESEGSEATKGLLAVDWDNHALVLQPVFSFLDSDLEATEPDITTQDIRKLFYNTEVLRKRESGEEEGEHEGDHEPEAGN